MDTVSIGRRGRCEHENLRCWRSFGPIDLCWVQTCWILSHTRARRLLGWTERSRRTCFKRCLFFTVRRRRLCRNTTTGNSKIGTINQTEVFLGIHPGQRSLRRKTALPTESAPKSRVNPLRTLNQRTSEQRGTLLSKRCGI